MTLKVTLDRIEGDWAVLLIRPDETCQILWPLNYLPERAKEGSIFTIDISVDTQETDSADMRVKDLLDKLLNRQNCVDG
ncbi:MAG: DUF3006 domain-containing protein [Bacillota bacterium]